MDRLYTTPPSGGSSGFTPGALRRVAASTSGGRSEVVFRVNEDGSATFIAGRVSHVSARHQARRFFGGGQKRTVGR